MRCNVLAAFAVVCAGTAQADLKVVFAEGAPKDRFMVENVGACPLGNLMVEIDLRASAAGLIFDVTGQGAGVEVFQPLELVSGQEFLTAVPDVRDGDTSVTLPLTDLSASGLVSFTIDVDDTAGTRATMISAAEIEGARVLVTQDGFVQSATFGRDSVATVSLNSCNA